MRNKQLACHIPGTFNVTTAFASKITAVGSMQTNQLAERVRIVRHVQSRDGITLKTAGVESMRTKQLDEKICAVAHSKWRAGKAKRATLIWKHSNTKLSPAGPKSEGAESRHVRWPSTKRSRLAMADKRI